MGVMATRPDSPLCDNARQKHGHSGVDPQPCPRTSRVTGAGRCARIERAVCAPAMAAVEAAQPARAEIAPMASIFPMCIVWVED